MLGSILMTTRGYIRACRTTPSFRKTDGSVQMNSATPSPLHIGTNLCTGLLDVKTEGTSHTDAGTTSTIGSERLPRRFNDSAGRSRHFEISFSDFSFHSVGDEVVRAIVVRSAEFGKALTPVTVGAAFDTTGVGDPILNSRRHKLLIRVRRAVSLRSV